MTTDIEGDRLALTIKCPVCEAPVGSVCVYVKPVPRTDLKFYRSRERQAIRAGHPTKRPHNERRALARMLEARRKYLLTPPGISKQRREQILNYRAYQQLLQLEHAQLRSWLIRYGHIITDVIS